MLRNISFLRNCMLEIKPYFNQMTRTMAGHSKWANIKHIKALKDGQRSANFQKLAQLIRVAIQEGKSANPGTNFQLQQAIDVAKRQNMPVDKINIILKTAQNSKNDATKSGLLELKGPGGCWILITILTDNITKTKSTVAPLIRKAGVVYSEGAAKHFFHHKGLVLAVAKSGITSLEAGLDHAIEAGAEEVKWDEEKQMLHFTCDPYDLKKVREKLQEFDYDINEANVQYIPHIFTELGDDHMHVLSILYDKLMDHPDVVSIYDNIA